MALSALAKIAGATTLAGTITLSGLTMWGGSSTVNNAMNKIQEQANQLNIFGTQQSQLVDKINSLKSVRDDLKAQIATLQANGGTDATKITDLQNQLDTANTQIADLQSKLSTSDTNANQLAQRISDLQDQLAAANSDAAKLQAKLDATNSTAAPMTDAEMAAATGDTASTPSPDPTPTPAVAPTSDPTPAPAPTNPTYKMGTTSYPIDGVKFETNGADVIVTNNTGGDITVKGVPGGSSSTIYNGNYRLVSAPNTIEIVKGGVTTIVDIIK